MKNVKYYFTWAGLLSAVYLCLELPDARLGDQQVLANHNRVMTHPVHRVSPERLLMAKRSSWTITEEQIGEILADHLRGVGPRKRRQVQRHLVYLCERYQFDPAFVLSVIHVESRFNAKAVSPVGARGLMQVMPRTGSYVASRFGIPYRGSVELHDPVKNLTIGVTYLYSLRKRYRGNVPLFLSAYNAGPTLVDRLVRRNRYGRRPQETKDYVVRIKDRIPFMQSYGLPEPSEEEIKKIEL